MTGTPPPINNPNQSLIDAINQLTQQLGARDQRDREERSRSALRRSIEKLGNDLKSYANPITRLTDSVKRLDKTNIQALKIGITNQKLADAVNKNSNLLSRNLTSNQELQEAIIDGFGKGVRFQTQGLNELTTEMVATNQNVKALNSLNSDLVLLTGNNISTIDRLAKVNKEVSDKYGVSNDRLIQTMASLKESLETASFFGAGAVESLGTVAAQLQGRAGGSDITGALSTLNRILVGGLETERAGAILGATGARQRLAAGGSLDISDIIPILEQLESRRNQIGGGRFGLDILSNQLGISKNQVAQLLQLLDISRKSFRVNEELKKTNDETYNSIENINKRALNFYDKTATGMLGVLGSVDTNLLFIASQIKLITAGAAAAGGGGSSMLASLFGGGSYADKIRAAGGGRGILKAGIGGTGLALGLQALAKGTLSEEQQSSYGNTLDYATIGASVGSFIPGLGTIGGGLIGGAVGLFMDMKDNTAEIAANTKKELEISEEERRQERIERAARERARLETLTGYLRSRINMEFGPEIVEAINRQTRATEELIRTGERTGTSARNGR